MKQHRETNATVVAPSVLHLIYALPPPEAAAGEVGRDFRGDQNGEMIALKLVIRQSRRRNLERIRRDVKNK